MRPATYRLALSALACAALAAAGCRTFSNSTSVASVDCADECAPAKCASGQCAPGQCTPGQCASGDCRTSGGCPGSAGTIVRPGVHGNQAACRNGECPHGGCPNCEPPKRWSREWYAMRSGDPVSARQVEHCGKLWPPYPRPTGEKPEFSHVYHAAHYWPYPFVCEDRAYVRSVLAMQEQNGWAEATTLYEYHFDADTIEVNQPGRLHLRWILQNPRPEYRVIYVQTADSAAVTEARLSAARLAAIEMVGEANLPPILPRVTDPLGRPAREIDGIQREIFETIPSPRIQYNALPTGTGSGS